VVVRPAHPSHDAADVAGLLHQLGYPDNTEQEVRDRLAAWDADPDAVVLVAELQYPATGAPGQPPEMSQAGGVPQLGEVSQVSRAPQGSGPPDGQPPGMLRAGEVPQAGEAQRRVAGVVAVAAVPYLEKPGRWARIVSLVVANDVRGNGIGRQLVTAAESAARDLDCVATELTSAQRRGRAHEFYRANGYEDWTGDVARLFHKQLRAGVATGPVAMPD
jgi:ribosomal protein S18 acetylase RimI-like enzyme